MRKALLLVLFLMAACSNTDLDPELHGMEPAVTPNLPEESNLLPVTAEDVNYHKDVMGYFARPVDDGTYSGVVMIHEWWGLNDNIKSMAEKLAGEGYLVLAVDLYDGRVATTSDEARELVGSFEQEPAIDNMKSAVEYLRDQGAWKIGSLGWCFGGGQSLQLGLNEDLDATIIYYGSLVTDAEELSAIEQPVLGIFAELDKGIPVKSVEEFDSALDELGVVNDINVYPGVDHAFANPSGDKYSKDEAEDAWRKTTTFLEEYLQYQD